MMTIDLKWLLPAAIPFAMIFMIRALAFFAGASWGPEAAAIAVIISAVIGVAVGLVAALVMDDEEVYWSVRFFVSKNQGDE